jgi:hypothetical protein
MSIFGMRAKTAIAGVVKKSQSQYFSMKNGFVTMSVTSVFFDFVSKVSGAIGKMDISKMSIF